MDKKKSSIEKRLDALLIGGIVLILILCIIFIYALISHEPKNIPAGDSSKTKVTQEHIDNSMQKHH